LVAFFFVAFFLVAFFLVAFFRAAILGFPPYQSLVSSRSVTHTELRGFESLPLSALNRVGTF